MSVDLVAHVLFRHTHFLGFCSKEEELVVVSVQQHAQWRSPSNLSMINSPSHMSFDSVVCMFLVTLDKVFVQSLRGSV